MVVPLVLTHVLPALGSRRGVWPTLLGVLLGMLIERGFKPSFLSIGVWKNTPEWQRIAIVSGLIAGVTVSVIDAFGRNAAFGRIVEQLWIPAYRALFFAIGLTMIRREVGRTPMIRPEP